MFHRQGFWARKCWASTSTLKALLGGGHVQEMLRCTVIRSMCRCCSVALLQGAQDVPAPQHPQHPSRPAPVRQPLRGKTSTTGIACSQLNLCLMTSAATLEMTRQSWPCCPCSFRGPCAYLRLLLLLKQRTKSRANCPRNAQLLAIPIRQQTCVYAKGKLAAPAKRKFLTQPDTNWCRVVHSNGQTDGA